MRREPLEYSHKDLIVNKLSKFNVPFSEFTFENIYLWRHESDYVVVEDEGLNFLEGIGLDKKMVIVPLDEVSNYQTYLKKHKTLALFPILKKWCDLFDDAEFVKETDRALDDYIYQTQKIADLSGRALDGKRNHVKHFQEDYNSRIVPIEKKYMSGMKALLEKWKKGHPGKTDYKVCLEALEEFERLKLRGICLLVDETVVGFAIGFAINNTMFDLQFVKADIEYKGVYAYLYQSFAKENSSYKWINFESDYGIEGLRKSRIEFAPDHIENKWRVRAK